jgi:hypothetical protein
MKKQIIAKYFAYSLLRDLGQEKYQYIRDNPIFRTMLKLRNSVSMTGPNGSIVNVVIIPEGLPGPFAVQDQSFTQITVNVSPPYYLGCSTDTPNWLQPVFDVANKRHNLFVLDNIYDCELTIAQLSKVIGWNVHRLVNAVLAAKNDESTVAQKILIGAVTQTDRKPAEWLIDIRGYSLSVLISQMMPDLPMNCWSKN